MSPVCTESVARLVAKIPIEERRVSAQTVSQPEEFPPGGDLMAGGRPAVEIAAGDIS